MPLPARLNWYSINDYALIFSSRVEGRVCVVSFRNILGPGWARLRSSPRALWTLDPKIQ